MMDFHAAIGAGHVEQERKKANDWQLEWPNMRVNRAQQITHIVLEIVQPFLQGPHDEQYVSDRLNQKLRELGAYILTDEARKQCGLPDRNAAGWTAKELGALEHKALEIMIRPLQSIVSSLYEEKEPFDAVTSWESNVNTKVP